MKPIASYSLIIKLYRNQSVQQQFSTHAHVECKYVHVHPHYFYFILLTFLLSPETNKKYNSHICDKKLYTLCLSKIFKCLT